MELCILSDWPSGLIPVSSVYFTCSLSLSTETRGGLPPTALSGEHERVFCLPLETFLA